MEAFLWSTLECTCVAAIVAVAVLTVTRWVKDPRVARVLWFVVLLKLVIPAPFVWRLSMSRPNEVTVGTTVAPSSIETIAPIGQLEDVRPFELTTEWQTPILEFDEAIVPLPDADTLTEASTAWGWDLRQIWPLAVLGAWGIGSIAFVAIVLTRSLGFSRMVARLPSAATGAQERAAQLAELLGVRNVPRLMMLGGEGGCSPMLWAFGKTPTIVLPSKLWECLTESERDTLILHELAHLKRNDHWFRLLETAIVAVHWWNPIAWLAQRRLMAAVEQCRDLDVLALWPDSARSYASAILRTLDFLAEGVAKPSLGLASSFSDLRLMKGRLHMILNDGPSRGWRSSLVKVLATLMGLGVIAGGVQLKAQDAPAPPTPVAAPSSVPTPTLDAFATPSAAPIRANDDDAMRKLDERLTRLERMIERVVEGEAQRREALTKEKLRSRDEADARRIEHARRIERDQANAQLDQVNQNTQVLMVLMRKKQEEIDNLRQQLEVSMRQLKEIQRAMEVRGGTPGRGENPFSPVNPLLPPAPVDAEPVLAPVAPRAEPVPNAAPAPAPIPAAVP